ncbi:MAG: acyl-CoA dehydrogenase [Acidimicrobiales bacterium]|nr:acyl-CoA dehydrogenase [Acidimicrobiales bacterium]
MDVRLSPEQQALRDSTAQIVDRLGPKAVGQLDDGERADKLEAAVASTGWRELRADDSGAPLAGGTEVALVAEELARGLADAAFLGPTLAAELRRLAGLDAADELETVVLGANLADVAHLSPDTASLAGFAVDAAGAAAALALIDGPDGSRVARVDLASIEPVGDPVDLTRTVVRVDGPVEVLDSGLDAMLDQDSLTRWTALGLAVASADLVGIMQGAVDLATSYACERRQYGAPIGSFQAVQHLLADALVATEGSRSSTLHAAWAVDALEPADALAAAAAAKAYSARAARKVCETAIQVHGGIGNTWECLAHVYLRRSLLSSEVLGGVSANLDRVLAHHGIGGN